MATPSNRQSARELVKQIAKDHGYISPEKFQQLETLGPEFRREIEEAFLKKDLLIGSTVITLAKNLYTSKARFVFELLQNADDNSYTRAIASGAVPYVAFHVYPRQIIVECNEDGFTDENLVAICSVGKSSKTGAQGYIGEKGIGFKSVFMVASKVHIQSGAFSFSFRHKNGESGMGMISPMWEETDEDLNLPVTRLTLHLHDTGDAEMLERTRESTQKQFEELQETILLFMKNLKRVHVSFFDDMLEPISSTTYSIERPRANYAVVKRTKVAANGATHEDVKHFHVTAHEATNLAKNENRNYSQAEETTRAYSKSQITLAFPLSESSVPIIEQQDLFVFLPVRPVGFNFLIQADFVTDASRQDVVQDSLRNNGLLGGIADAFLKAISQFCEHDTLKFQWMRYLPDKNGLGWSRLWLSLVNMIADRLTKSPILYGRNMSDRHLIRDLVRPTDAVLDGNGRPLFYDDPEQIVSQDYDNDDLSYLSDYGLRVASFAEIIEWVRSDIRRGDLSRMISPKTSESWHTRAAQLLHTPFEMKWINSMKALKTLELLPLEDGTWVSALRDPVYFAQVDGMDIPSDVQLRVVSKSVANAARMTLFKSLGAKTASMSLVRKEILRLYSPRDTPPSPRDTSLSFESSKRHLEFLYLTENSAGDDEPNYSSLRIYRGCGQIHQPFDGYVYVVNDEPYGAWELLRKTGPGPNPGNCAPGYFRQFVNKKYFEDCHTTIQMEKWVQWFYDKLNVANGVQFDFDHALYGAATYLQRYRPEKFLGAIYMQYQPGQYLSSHFICSMQEYTVLCRGNRQIPLKLAYFPTKELEKRVEKFVGHGVFFPWLWLDIDTHPDVTPDVIPPRWNSLLTNLKVGFPLTDLDFALDMLEYSLDGFPTTVTSSDTRRLFELYDHIQEKYREDEKRKIAQKKIIYLFSERKCIYIPRRGTGHSWAFPNECVWNAPQQMTTKFALKRLYGTCFCRDGAECPHFTPFFLHTLGIAECTWEVYAEELKELKNTGCDNIDTIITFYKAINDLSSKTTDNMKIKETFENDALIYVPSDDGATSAAWHKLSDCVWSKAAKLRGRVSLSDDYEDLEELFVAILGIKPVDLSMAIDELKEAGSRRSTSVTEVKESIWTVNSLLSTEPSPPKPSAIVKSAIFPVRHPNGGVTCETAAIEFFLVDREPLRQSFETKVKFLDFTLEEVVRLGPFLEWTHLNGRHLSHCVKEITSPGEGASPISNPYRQIRNRAYPLLRIASHFDSPRSQSKRDLESLYQVLRTSEVWETGGISSDVQLSQDGTLHVVESKKITLHIDEDQSGLKVYIPRNKDDQEYTYTNFLSRKLFQWMMTHPITQISEGVSKDGVNATRDILLAPRSRITTALEDNGIATINIANIDEDIPESESLTPRPAGYECARSSTADTQEDSEEEIISTPISSVEIPLPRSHDGFASSRIRYSGLSRPISLREDHFTPSVPSRTPSPFTPTRNVTPDQPYVAVLDTIIAAARRSTISSHGAFGMSQMYANLPNAQGLVDLGLHFSNQIERNCKIGAAGELYVFELLSHLCITRHLPGFDRRNWKSNIRKYVTAHPEYADMEPWTGQETSDITYSDYEGVLTDALIEKDYLARDVWEGKRPEYFIEVKSTTMSCDTPFYMSKAQYRRMRGNTLTAGNTTKIYAIFRVYYLGQDNMGLKVYLDPESLRLSGQLKFTAETWSVVPNEADQNSTPLGVA